MSGRGSSRRESGHEHRRGGAEQVPAPTERLVRVLEVPTDVATLELALTHRSFAYENGGLPTNERLEFLGDSVLGLVVTETLYRAHPDLPEGQLAKLRAAVVNMRALADVARELDLGAHVRLGRGEETTGGRDKSSILADTLEAVIGAVYLSGGLERAATLVHRLFDPLIEASATLGAGLDWKTSLQELAAGLELGVPEYVVDESGPDHAKSFRASVRLGDALYGNGAGRSKKEAEQQAAATAWAQLRELHGAPDGTPPHALAAADAVLAATAEPPVSPRMGAGEAPEPRQPVAPDGVDGSADGAAR